MEGFYFSKHEEYQKNKLMNSGSLAWINRKLKPPVQLTDDTLRLVIWCSPLLQPSSQSLWNSSWQDASDGAKALNEWIMKNNKSKGHLVVVH